jgi:hypothetical protein
MMKKIKVKAQTNRERLAPPSGWRNDSRKLLLAKPVETSHLRRCENDGKSVLTLWLGWTEAFLDERALWISAFPDELQEATLASCTQANQWIKTLCEHKGLSGG